MSNNPDNNNGENLGPGPTDSTAPPKAGKFSRRLRNLLWVVIILLIGAVVGAFSFLFIAPHIVFVGGHTPFPFPPFISSKAINALATLIAEHIILSTVSIALLASLLLVYTRTYVQTRANFALGIFVVLLALLFEAILAYPILQLLLGPVSSSEFSSPLPTIASIFTVVAYSVFLYLSLE